MGSDLVQQRRLTFKNIFVSFSCLQTVNNEHWTLKSQLRNILSMLPLCKHSQRKKISNHLNFCLVTSELCNYLFFFGNYFNMLLVSSKFLVHCRYKNIFVECVNE